MNSRLDMTRQGDAILKRARYDSITGALKDRQYYRNKNAEQRRRARHSRARRKKLGRFGPASPARRIEIGKD
jgi:hypothetical protein